MTEEQRKPFYKETATAQLKIVHDAYYAIWMTADILQRYAEGFNGTDSVQSQLLHFAGELQKQCLIIENHISPVMADLKEQGELDDIYEVSAEEIDAVFTPVTQTDFEWLTRKDK